MKKMTKKDEAQLKAQILRAYEAMWHNHGATGPGYLENDFIEFDVLPKKGVITARVRGRRYNFVLQRVK